MLKDGIDIESLFENGGKHTKIELQSCVPSIISQDEYNSIGEYRFVRGTVFLKYLTDSSYSTLKEWELEYYMEQLTKTIKSQLTVATVVS